MSEAGYTELITAAHRQLHAPVILCCGNFSPHLSTAKDTRVGVLDNAN